MHVGKHSTCTCMAVLPHFGAKQITSLERSQRCVRVKLARRDLSASQDERKVTCLLIET